METQAGRERENLTVRILDADNVRAVYLLIGEIGSRSIGESQQQMDANGGGTLNLQDLCRIASNAQLRKVCKKLGV